MTMIFYDELSERIASEVERAGPGGITGDEIVQRLGADETAVYLRLGWLSAMRIGARSGLALPRVVVIGGYDPSVSVSVQRFVAVAHAD